MWISKLALSETTLKATWKIAALQPAFFKLLRRAAAFTSKQWGPSGQLFTRFVGRFFSEFFSAAKLYCQQKNMNYLGLKRLYQTIFQLRHQLTKWELSGTNSIQNKLSPVYVACWHVLFVENLNMGNNSANISN